jgi:hypothetical protein
VTFATRVLFALHATLTRHLLREVIMSFAPASSVIFAAPPAVAASLQAYLIETLVRLGGAVDAVTLTQRLGPDGGDYANPSFYAGAMTLSEAEILLIRSEFRAGGALYDAGCRARRLLFPPKEIAAPGSAAGKITVDVIDALPIPGGVDWETTRVTVDAFYAELGLPGAPLVVLSPPEDNL